MPDAKLLDWLERNAVQGFQTQWTHTTGWTIRFSWGEETGATLRQALNNAMEKSADPAKYGERARPVEAQAQASVKVSS